MKATKRVFILLCAVVLFSSSLLSCAYMAPLVGGGLGAGAGILLDPGNRWRGALIGSLIGGIGSLALVEIAKRSAMQSLHYRRPVTYNHGGYYGQVQPYGNEYYDPQQGTYCQKVRNRVWRNGDLVEDNVTEACRSRTSYPGYMQGPGQYEQNPYGY